jgi:hypothetical protein
VNNSASFPDVEFYISTQEDDDDDDEVMTSPGPSRRPSWEYDADASAMNLQEELPQFPAAAAEQTGGEKELEQYRSSLVAISTSAKPVTKNFFHFVGHRCIVGARCPVFAAIFVSHANDVAHSAVQQQEEALGLTSIQQTIHLRVDVEPAVFLEFLFFLYTDTLPASLSVQRLPSLFVLADMYLVERLKYVCEVQLTKKLTIDNLLACATEVAATLPISIPLHNIVKAYLAENLQAVESNKVMLQSLPEEYREFVEKKGKGQREAPGALPAQTQQLELLRLRNAV